MGANLSDRAQAGRKSGEKKLKAAMTERNYTSGKGKGPQKGTTEQYQGQRERMATEAASDRFRGWRD